MQDYKERTVREIAIQLPLTTRVFENFHIDYCCGGNRKFNDACNIAGADPSIVLVELAKLEESVETETNWIDRSVSDLVNHILDKHHVFTRDAIQNISSLMAKVSTKHGEVLPDLLLLEHLFVKLSEDLGTHLQKEEQILFPYVLQLERIKSGGAVGNLPCFGTVQNPVRMIMKEHDSAGDFLKEMRVVTNDYKLPENACMSFTALYARLEEFEKDLHQHIHLENNILFPRAISLEKEVYLLKG